MLPETLQYRRDSQDLTADLARAWSRLWPVLNVRALDESFPRWAAGAAAVVGSTRTKAETLAADYMRNFSDFPAVAAEPIDPARFSTSMRITATIPVKVATRNGASLSEASAAGLSSSLGSASRMVLDAGRDVVTGTSVADPNCVGWQRVGVGGCEFCRMLIGRGAVYREATAHFLSHDRCHCSAEPVMREQQSTPLAGVMPGGFSSLSDDAIQAEVERLMEAGDFDDPRMEELARELDQRDQIRARYAEEIARDEWEKKQAADRAAGILRRPAGPSKAAQERALRDEYETWVEIQFLAAESACRGVMLSHAGKVAHIRPRDLFTRRRPSLKWASEELKEWFARNPRMSFQEFRAGSRSDDSARMARTRSANRGWESEFG